jgi:hypothetical protein
MRHAARLKRASAAIAAALLAGCTAPAPTPPPPQPPTVVVAPPRAPSAADELLAYLARLRALDEAGLALETGRQRDFARREPSNLANLKVALVLVAAGEADEAEVLFLVEPMLREGAVRDADVVSMASFLQVVVLERRRLKESAAASGTKSRDDRRAYETQKARADAVLEKNLQLQQKLDALTALEKSLSSRKTQGK